MDAVGNIGSLSRAYKDAALKELSKDDT